MKKKPARRRFHDLQFEEQINLARPLARRLLRGAFDTLQDEPVVSFIATLIDDPELAHCLPGADQAEWHRLMDRIAGGVALGVACASLIRPEIFDAMERRP